MTKKETTDAVAVTTTKPSTNGEEKVAKASAPLSSGRVMELYRAYATSGKSHQEFLEGLQALGKYKTQAQAKARFSRLRHLLKSRSVSLVRLRGAPKIPKKSSDLVEEFGDVLRARF